MLHHQKLGIGILRTPHARCKP